MLSARKRHPEAANGHFNQKLDSMLLSNEEEAKNGANGSVQILKN